MPKTVPKILHSIPTSSSWQPPDHGQFAVGICSYAHISCFRFFCRWTGRRCHLREKVSGICSSGPQFFKVVPHSLGSARFLKTVKCRHKNGCLVIKIFIKPDPGMSLRTHQRRLKSWAHPPSFQPLVHFMLKLDVVDREALADIPNVYNYQAFVETDKAGYIIRQWVASSLYDRIRSVANCLQPHHLHVFL